MDDAAAHVGKGLQCRELHLHQVWVAKDISSPSTPHDYSSSTTGAVKMIVMLIVVFIVTHPRESCRRHLAVIHRAKEWTAS
jgi:hypothetical protein